MSIKSRVVKQRQSKNDNIYTPPQVAKLMIEMSGLQSGDRVLDPCAGENKVFYNNFPRNTIRKYCNLPDKDFFEFKKTVDCIVGNPPYSKWNDWLKHTIKLTDKFCYIFGQNNLTQARLHFLFENGFGLTKMHYLNIDWWFGSSIVCLFERGKESIITITPKRIHCEMCDGRCGRGRNNRDYNRCAISIE